MAASAGGEAPFANNNVHPNLDLPFPKPLPTGITFSFSAGGWLQNYMFGVCHALQQSGVIDHYNAVVAGQSQSQSQSQQHQFTRKDSSSAFSKDTETTNNNSKKKNGIASSATSLNSPITSNSTPTTSFTTTTVAMPVRYVGASAGALAASCLAADLDMIEVRDFTLDCGEHMNSKWYHYFFMKDYVDIAINKFATEIMSRDAETHSHEVQDRLRNTLGIYCTVLPWFKKKKFDVFTSVEDVKEALFASLCAAPMVGFPFRLRSTGELVVDGGIAAFQPKSGKSNVITVSPFYFANADVKPSHFLPMTYAFRPPSRKAHAALFDLGYNDAIDFLVRKQYLSPQNSMHIRRPDPKPPRRSVFAIFKDFAFLIFTYIMLRPLAIVVVYMEMVIMASYYFVRTFLSSSNGGATIVDWFETVANLCSPSVFMHMAVSPRIPVNEKRLAKRSISFRVFAPIFGTPHDDDDNDDNNNSSSITNEIMNNRKKKRFAVHTPVGSPNQTQLLFDRFRNLGWSGGNSMFKEEDGKVVYSRMNSGNSSSNQFTTTTTTTTNSASELLSAPEIDLQPQQEDDFSSSVKKKNDIIKTPQLSPQESMSGVTSGEGEDFDERTASFSLNSAAKKKKNKKKASISGMVKKDDDDDDYDREQTKTTHASS